MIIYHGISLVLLAIGLLIVGMFKPKWILFWMERPTRLMIGGICMVLFMIGAILFGEGNKQKKLEMEKEKQAATLVSPGKPTNDLPETESKPAAPAAPPAQPASTSANDLRP